MCYLVCTLRVAIILYNRSRVTQSTTIHYTLPLNTTATNTLTFVA